MTVRTPAVDSEDELAGRYGRGPVDRRRNRWWFVVTAAAFVVVFGAWLWWGGLSSPAAQLEARDAAYEVVDDRTVTVQWRLTVEPGTPAKCAVQALNARYGVVGWKVVDVPPSEQRTRLFTEQLRTTERAETGLIYRCWLT
ncbi:DUF4307 domain-containing protein [Lysobacter korlensis]|uniref:DUF4307 domain-containing protein n=1 Tax=Lysobacter korlensis TaxID=553636 RepID=A0ABV6S2H1_9GAMM